MVAAVRLVPLLALIAGAVALPDRPLDDVTAQRAALSTVQKRSLTAATPSLINAELNHALLYDPAYRAAAKPCEELSVAALADAVATLRAAAVVELQAAYAKRADLRALPPAVVSAARRAAEAAGAHPAVRAAMRDAKCHEAALIYTHHLDAAGREEARELLTLPLLPVERSAEQHQAALARLAPYDAAAAHAKAAHAAATVCAIGHNAKALPGPSGWTPKDWPTWPDEVEYNATGYGPYPFWMAGGGVGGCLGPGVDPENPDCKGTQLKVWWSALKNTERFDHNGKCSLSGVGPDGKNVAGPQDQPCTHLFSTGEFAYLFTQKRDWCCQSSGPKSACHMTRPQRDFWKVFTNEGTPGALSEGYKSESGYYNGTIKNYTMHLTNPQNFHFWYLTDLHDRPIEQGEGPCVRSYDGLRTGYGCSGPPKYLYHQYDPRTFREAKLEARIFEVPEICKRSASNKVPLCLVSPTIFCTQPDDKPAGGAEYKARYETP